MALLETPHLNQSAFLKLKTPDLNVAAMAKFSASFNDFPSCFLPNAIKRNDKVVEEIFWHQKIKNGCWMQTLKTLFYCGN